MNVNRLVQMISIWAVLIFPGMSWAATYFVDSAQGDDNSSGTISQPFKTWQKVQSVLKAGDTALLSGDIGDVAITGRDPVGTMGSWITYEAWPGKPVPKFLYIHFDGTIKNAFLKFVGIRVDPGYVESPRGMVVGLRGAHYVTFEDSYFEDEKVAGEAINQADFAPYVFFGSHVISSGESPALASHITISNCTLRNAYRAIYAVQHPNSPDRKVENWVIKNNDFSDCGEDAITTSGSGGHLIANNYFHDHNNHKGYKVPFYWAGTPSGNWEGKKFQKVIQDVTGDTGLFYEIGKNSSDQNIIILYADDLDHTPGRKTTNTWRLQNDPGIYFTPFGTGDNAHTDFIAVQGGSHDMIIENNIFDQDDTGAQIIKIEPATRNITFRNNLLQSDYVGAYLILLAGFNVRLYHNTIDVRDNIHPVSALRLITTTAPGADDSDVYFYNNIISGAVYTSGTIHSDYNIWGSAPPTHFNEGPHSKVSTNYDFGVFITRANKDYRLADQSPAIDFGNARYSITSDLVGHFRDERPDAGCYEYGQGAAAPVDLDATNELIIQKNVLRKGASISIEFDISEDSDVSIIIYDRKGQEVKIVVSEGKAPGHYSHDWDGKNTNGTAVASGIYTVQMKAGNVKQTKKVAVVK